MMFVTSFINRIKVIRRYSLKTVSIVAVLVFAAVSCVTGCGADRMNVDGVTEKNDELHSDGSDVLNDSSEINAADKDEANDAGQDDAEQGCYGQYPVKAEINYQWCSDGTGELMYILTNPNMNVALRGAGIDTDVNVMAGTSCVATVIVPVFLKEGDTLEFHITEGISRQYFFAEFDHENCEYTCSYVSGWQDMKDELVTIPYDTYVMLDYGFSNTATDDATDLSRKDVMTAEQAAVIESATYISRNSVKSAYENLYSYNDALLSEIEVNEGKSAEGNPYILVKIPSELSNGQQVMPELQQTSWMEYYAYPVYEKLTDKNDIKLFRSILSPLMYAQVYHTAFTINAGLFNIYSHTPQGQTVIDGVVVTNNPMKDDIGDPISLNTECYAMTIDAAGVFDYAKHEDGRPFRTVDAGRLVEEGCRDVITGWGCIVYDGISVVELDSSKVTEDTVFYEQVHRKKVAHQVIGQDRAGNYFILSTNDVNSGYGYGLNYDEAAEIMIAAGATFAYMLDGGDSVATVLDGTMLTECYFENYGKPVPTVISFVAR